ncbi:MAG: PorT family protein [Bacteroidales bacterium]|nr:PorT family protein [Bacteroidales bacterium]
MIDKRNNNDWTDALRERLDSSVLPPSSDIWSKVESRSGLAAQGSKAGRKPVFAWATAAAIAAALALFFIISPFRTSHTDASGLMAEEDSVPVMPAADLIDILPAEQTLVAEAALPVRKTAVPSEHAVIYEETTATAEPVIADPAAAEQETLTGEPAGQWDDWDDFFTEPDAAPKRKVRLSMSVAGISGVSGASDAGNGFDRGNPPISNPPQGGTISSGVGEGTETKATGTSAPQQFLRHHYRPVSLGLALTYPFADRWFLESGLNYSYLRTDIEMDSRGQKLHFLGVPLKAGYVLGASSHFSVSISAGAMAEKLVYGEISGREIAIKEPQFSAIATAAVQYRIGNGLYLFLAPELSYYLTETAIPSYHTEHPASLTLRLGVNVSLGAAK